jgi:hypothetical protein
VINQGLFQLSWPACVIGAAYGLLWTGLLVVGMMVLWQLNRANRHRLDLRMIACAWPWAWCSTRLDPDGPARTTPRPGPGRVLHPLWIMLLWLAWRW